ncbi:hypothetical protein [Nonomuraea sp. NPDC049480]|uniref:hypothetical protein n=1 Tax=Nonomuraea sp. NPDC049480 TaxID=3364353 RepID=UPI0037975A58
MLKGPSPGCAFAPRCAFAEERCEHERPEPVRVREQDVLCHRATELGDRLISRREREDHAVTEVSA